VQTGGEKIQGVLILADESSEWVVAGLRQLDRLALALNEYGSRSGRFGPMPVSVYWIDHQSERRLPPAERLPHLSLTNDVERFRSELADNEDVLVFNSRLVVGRGGFSRLLENMQCGEDTPVLRISATGMAGGESLPALIARAAQASDEARSFERNFSKSKWCSLRDAKDIPAAERQLLRNTGKSQDGLVARFINRPISRNVSRFLVRFPLAPNQWTVLALAMPIAGSVFLMRGDYVGFAVGAVLFQLQSALDGCDGEISRAKYLESEQGTRLDCLCDRWTTILLAIGLGIGLSSQAALIGPMRWIYLVEGSLAALLISVGETLLQRRTIDQHLEHDSQEDNLSPEYVRTHWQNFNETDHLKVWAIKNSGMLSLGEAITSFFVQATKRDVFNFGFALLILFGRPQWVLHILAVAAGAIVIFALRNLLSAAPKGTTV
jgi:hypothetical protein